MHSSLRQDLQASLRAGLPAALLLALAVGLVVVVGANLSNAFPSAAKPFGWPGPANFENGVAMVRPELVLAASLPALLLGLRAFAGVEKRESSAAFPTSPPTPILAPLLAGPILITLAVLSATLIGAGAATSSPSEAYFAFFVAHLLLALSCFSIGLVAVAATRRHSAVAGLASWGFFAFLMDNSVRWKLFRSEGYDNLAAGLLPTWFYLMQALSPVSAYRAILILWRPGFRDYLEHAALDKATMPGWLGAPSVALVMLVLWVAIPLAVAAGILYLRNRRAASGPGSSAASPILPLSPLAPTGASAVALDVVDAPTSNRTLHGHGPGDRPPPMTAQQRRPRLNADSKTDNLRASFGTRPATRQHR